MNEKYKTTMILFIMLSGLMFLLYLFFPSTYSYISSHKAFGYAIYIASITGMVCITSPKIPIKVENSRKIEYVVQGNGVISNQVFLENDYPSYRKVAERENEYGYMGPQGDLIITRVKTVTNVNKGENIISLLIFGVIYSFLLLFLFEIIVLAIQDEISVKRCWEIVNHNIDSKNLLHRMKEISEKVTLFVKIILEVLVKVFATMKKCLNRLF